MASTLITEYIGRGTFASRPVTPNVPAGCSAVYTTTDTAQVFVWNGSAWKQLFITGSGPSLVQAVTVDRVASGNLSSGITMSTAPIQNNILVALVFGQSSIATAQTAPNIGSGWVYYGRLAGSLNTCVFIKECGASETTSQTPTGETGNGSIVCMEFANCQGFAVDPGIWTYFSIASSATPSLAITPLRNGYAIGYFRRAGTATITVADAKEIARLIGSAETIAVSGAQCTDGVVQNFGLTFSAAAAFRTAILLI